MAQRSHRRNEVLLGLLRALGVASFTWFGLASMHVRPGWLALLLGLVAGGLMLASADLGVLVSILALSAPVIAVEPLAGIMMLILGVAATRYLAASNGSVFIVIAAVIVGAYLGPVWTGVALAGYLLGAGEGAIAAALACLTLEALGLALGRPGIGVTATGGSEVIVSFLKAPDTLLSGQWITSAFSGLGTSSVNRLMTGVSALTHPITLLLQPVAWAAAAATAGFARRGARGPHADLIRTAVVGGAVAVAALGTVAIDAALGIPVPWATWAWSLVSSLTLVVAFVIVESKVFPRLVVVPAREVSLASEDADVDELLRLIATAEDRLAAQHTSQRIVLITDMKSFSNMTEEDGSVATAKAIQRHRDLLLPVVSGHGGHGKSTGGDGLVAAFESAANALLAATEMQTALAAHNAVHPNEREIWVRIGLAMGEVVLDKGGRPFIGAGLNLAARIMNLADGGQILASGEVASAAQNAGVRVHYFGQVELKNIAKPVEIAEVLWSDEQLPRDPRAEAATNG